jgi:hypothetical protein
MRYRLAFTAILLLVSTRFWAESTRCISPTFIVPDGRSVESYFATTEYWFAFYGVAGHSYALEFGALHSNNNSIIVSPTVYAPVDKPSTGAGSSLGVNTTSFVDPSMGDGRSSRRRSWIAPTSGNYFIRLVFSGSDLVSYRVVDTTLYNTLWCTVSNYQTQLSFRNTTSIVIACKLTLTVAYRGVGSISRAVVLAPASSKFMTVGADGDLRQSGTAGDATLACDGAPGSVIASAYLFRGGNTVVSAVPFAPRISQR